jgi:pimeloyl-ACP methyl ester carboxylesterase
MFLHGFPEAAFIWDDLLDHFAQPENGGYRCIAPNLRGFERSSQPLDASAYRVKHLLQDITSLVGLEGPHLSCLIAHDWGGAVAWSLANQKPELLDRLVIVNSPHPATFLRELTGNPAQQAASAYMNFLIRPDAEELLAQDDYRRLWEFFTSMGASDGRHAWLTPTIQDQYRSVWSHGLTGGCNYYRASPLRPDTDGQAGLIHLDLPRSMLEVNVPTQVIWGMGDIALPGELLLGLSDYVARLDIRQIPDASHWIVHEQPGLVIDLIAQHLNKPAEHPVGGS